MNFMKKFCGRHFISSEHILGHTKPNQPSVVGKPVLVWCKTNDQTVFNLTSTNGQFTKPVRNQIGLIEKTGPRIGYRWIRLSKVL